MKFYCFIFILALSLKAHAADCEAAKPISVYKPTYAEYFTISYYDNYKIIDAGKAPSLERYIVADGALKCETSLAVLTSKTKRFVSSSTTHLYFLSAFNLEHTLVGFQGTRYIFNEKIRAQKMKEINYQMNAEELFALRPDLVMAYSANAGAERAKQLRKLKIPIVLNYDFEERHPLARAEWIVFEAVFFGKDKEAQELFNKIKLSYNEFKHRAAGLKKSKVLVGDIQRGKWSTCGGTSDLAIIINDAGGELLLKSQSNQTQYVSLEKVLKINERPDVWFSQNTWEDAKAMGKDSRYKKFQSVPLFNNTKLINKDGFSDFWETGVARPDLLIKDFFAIMHPSQFPNEKTIWYKELK